jgi:riboflavin synthase
MFTGLVERVGRVVSKEPHDRIDRLRIETDLSGALRVGESVAVNGVCLTVTTRDGSGFTADIGPETSRITTLGRLGVGQDVNLERSMPADGRFGGHFVQGHVDGIGVVEQLRDDGEAHWMTVTFPDALAPFFILKGAVTIDGISLTVAALHECRFEVMIIPHTWSATNLSRRRAGDAVNLECDMIGKYVARALEAHRHSP